jgi:hypothetical protein
VTLFFVAPAHAGVLDTLGNIIKDFVCWVSKTEFKKKAKEINEAYPRSGLFQNYLIEKALNLVCGKGTSGLPSPEFDYEQLLNDIRDIFKEELQEAFDNDNVQDAYAEITGAIEYLLGSFQDDSELYKNDLSNARLQIQMALEALEAVEANLVEQGVKTKSLVLGPYEAGIGALISIFQELYWVISQTNDVEARKYFFDAAVPIIEKKINKLEYWVKETREYLRARNILIIPPNCKIINYEPICSRCVYAYIPGGIIKVCSSSSDLLDLALAMQELEEKIEKYVYWEMTPTLLSIEVLIALWRMSLKGDWMPPLDTSLTAQPYFLPLSFPLVNISSDTYYTNAVVSKEMKFPSGWSMFSLPVNPENPLLSELFPDAVLAYRYEKGKGYVRIYGNDKLEVGEAYWILLNEGHNYTLIGKPIENFALSAVQNGWHMVGACTSPAKISTRNAEINLMYKYSPGVGYKRVLESDNMEPGCGYWIHIINTVYKANTD